MSTEDIDPSHPPPDALPAGALLGDTYEVVRHIKRGGMADVYEAKNVHTNEPVALKVVLAEFARNDLFLSMFRKEGAVLSRLHNDAIVRYQVFTVDRETKRPYLVMEYIDGVALSDVILMAPMAPGDVHRLMQRLAFGLGAAHQLKVVHRDLKPDNIILPDGDVSRAKVIDFGIAKTEIGGGTLVGSGFAGTYLFVSPEQLGLFGNEVTERSDIYSLGLVLAAALLGKPIDMGGSHLDVIEKRRVVPDLGAIDASMRPIVASMLEPNPADRPQTMAAVMALELASQDEGPSGMLPVGEDIWSLPQGPRGDETVVRPGPVPTPSIPPSRPKSIPPASRPDENATRLIEVARIAQSRTQELRAPGSTTVFAPPTKGGIKPVDPSTLGGAETPFGAEDAVAPPPQVETTARAGAGRWRARAIWIGVLVVVAGAGAFAVQSGLLGRLQGNAGTSIASSEAQPQSAGTESSIAPEASQTSVSPPGPPANLAAEAQPWVDNFAKGDCEFAFASVAENGSVSIRQFSESGTPIAGLSTGFAQWAGVTPSVTALPIEAEQCAVFEFLNATRPVAVPGPEVSVDRNVLGNGDSLVGRVTKSDGWTTTVMLVDNRGNLYDVTSRLSGQGADKSFTYPLELRSNAEAGENVPMLVVAISSKAPIAAMAKVSNGTVWTTFRAIRNEITDKATEVAVSLAWFQIS